MYISGMEYITEKTTFSSGIPMWVVTCTEGDVEVSYEYVEDLYYDEESDSYQ